MKAVSQKDRRALLLSLMAVLGVMGLIFSFSAQTGEDSGELSAALVNFFLRVSGIEMSALTPEEQTALWDKISFIIRKLAHFSEFALLGAALRVHTGVIYRIRPYRFSSVIAAASGVLYAVSDELHQGFVDGRAPSLRDVGIDSCGAVFGVLFVLTILCFSKNKLHKIG